MATLPRDRRGEQLVVDEADVRRDRTGQTWLIHRGTAGVELALIVGSYPTNGGKLWYHRCMVLESEGDPEASGEVWDLGEGKHDAWDRADDRERIA